MRLDRWGKKTANVEQAIAAYKNALKVRTPTSAPQECAETNLMLGMTYLLRPTGSIDENTKQAIASLQAAAQMITPMENPGTWVMIQAKLADAYSQRMEIDGQYFCNY